MLLRPWQGRQEQSRYVAVCAPSEPCCGSCGSSENLITFLIVMFICNWMYKQEILSKDGGKIRKRSVGLDFKVSQFSLGKTS